MAWTPKHKIIDTRPFIENLLTFVENNQEDAFLWANPTDGLKPFAGIYNSAEGRVIDLFPNLLAVNDRIETPPFLGDVITSVWTVGLEIALEGSDATKLTIEARKYEYALRSILANIGQSNLLADATKAAITSIDVTDTIFDVIGKGIKSKYTQVFQMTARFVIEGSAK
jgi:hypothetical protein